MLQNFRVIILLLTTLNLFSSDTDIDKHIRSGDSVDLTKGTKVTNMPYGYFIGQFGKSSIKGYDKIDLSEYEDKKLLVGYGVYDIKDENCRYLDVPSNSTFDIAFEKRYVINNNTYGISRDKMSYSQCISKVAQYSGFIFTPKDVSEMGTALRHFGQDKDMWLGYTKQDCNSNYLNDEDFEQTYENFMYPVESCTVNNRFTFTPSNTSQWLRTDQTNNYYCPIKINSPDYKRPIKFCMPWWRVERQWRLSGNDDIFEFNGEKYDLRYMKYILDYPKDEIICSAVDVSTIINGVFKSTIRAKKLKAFPTVDGATEYEYYNQDVACTTNEVIISNDMESKFIASCTKSTSTTQYSYFENEVKCSNTDVNDFVSSASCQQIKRNFDITCNSFDSIKESPTCIDNIAQDICHVNECKGYIENTCVKKDSYSPFKDYDTGFIYIDNIETRVKIKENKEIHSYTCPQPPKSVDSCLAKEEVTVFPAHCPGSKCDELSTCLQDKTNTFDECIDTYPCEKSYGTVDNIIRDSNGIAVALGGVCKDGSQIEATIEFKSRTKKTCLEYDEIIQTTEDYKTCTSTSTSSNKIVSTSITADDEYSLDERCIRTNNIGEARPSVQTVFEYNTKGFFKTAIQKSYMDGEEVSEETDSVIEYMLAASNTKMEPYTKTIDNNPSEDFSAKVLCEATFSQKWMDDRFYNLGGPNSLSSVVGYLHRKNDTSIEKCREGAIVVENRCEHDVVYNNIDTSLNSGINGIQYFINGTYIDVTGADGSFEYNNGDTLTFKVGKITVGSFDTTNINSDGKILPQDIIGVPRGDTSNPQVLKMAQFLQSIDDDGDPSNGIIIPTATITTFDTLAVADISTLDTFELKTIVASVGKTLKRIRDVIQHLDDTVVSTGININSTMTCPSGFILNFIDRICYDNIYYNYPIIAISSNKNTCSSYKTTLQFSQDTNGSVFFEDYDFASIGISQSQINNKDFCIIGGNKILGDEVFFSIKNNIIDLYYTSAVNKTNENCKNIAKCITGDVVTQYASNSESKTCIIHVNDNTGIPEDTNSSSINAYSPDEIIRLEDIEGTFVGNINGYSDVFSVQEYTEGDFGYISNYIFKLPKNNIVKIDEKEVSPIIGQTPILYPIKYDFSQSQNCQTTKNRTPEQHSAEASGFRKVTTSVGDGVSGNNFVDETIKIGMAPAMILFGRKQYWGWYDSYYKIFQEFGENGKFKENLYGYDPRLIENGVLVWDRETASSGTIKQGDYSVFRNGIIENKRTKFSFMGYSSDMISNDMISINENNTIGWLGIKWYKSSGAPINTSSISQLNMDISKYINTIYMGAVNSLSIVVPYKGEYEVKAYDANNNLLATKIVQEQNFISNISSTSGNIAQTFAKVQLATADDFNIAPGQNKNLTDGGCIASNFVEWGGGVSGAYYERGVPDIGLGSDCYKSNDGYVKSHSATKITLRAVNSSVVFAINLKKPMPYPNRIVLTNLMQLENRKYECHSELLQCHISNDSNNTE